MGLFDRFKKAEDKPASNITEILAPVDGELVQLSETNEPVFGSEMMGKGCAINPTSSTVISPISGKVSVVMPHAVGIIADNGVEVMVHVGIDTVEMKGDGFDLKVAQGDTVTCGQELLAFSREKVAEAGHPDTTFVIITNTAECAEVAPIANRTVKVGDVVVSVTK